MTTATASWLPNVLAKIDELSTLKENWNSYNARPIDPKSIAAARRVAAWLAGEGVDLEPHVVPTSRGTVNLEWPSVELEVEFRPDAQMKYLAVGTTSDRGDLLRFLKP